MSSRPATPGGQRPQNGPPSPCIGVCRMDTTSGLCAGCWRTLAEIAAWSSMESQGKLQVLSLLPERRQRWPVLPAIAPEPAP